MKVIRRDFSRNFHDSREFIVSRLKMEASRLDATSPLALVSTSEAAQQYAY